jgi:hypothetical protein
MNIEKEMLEFDLGNDIDGIFDKNIRYADKFEVEPNMIDFMIGKDNNCSTLRYEQIKNIEDNNEKIEEMAKYLKEEIVKQDFPDELYLWIARDVLGLKYKKYEIEEMKRQYRIKKKREAKEIKEAEKNKKLADKQRKKCLRREVKETILKF